MKDSELHLYNTTSHASASVVIRQYSTSFGWACRLLDARARPHIENIYALVRVADELVDGPATSAGVDSSTQRLLLDELEQETERALAIGYSTNLIVHAFAFTARRHSITMDLCRPFFASMRCDLDQREYDVSELAEYIYGSAEVVGLMCLRVFEAGRERSAIERERLVDGARALGAAFQKINFLRDYGRDHDGLGRAYFAGTRHRLTDTSKADAVASIRSDLQVADATIPLLAPGCRAAVWAARSLFVQLTDQIEATPALVIEKRRVSVPATVKAAILARALAMKAAK
ncbi:phytoene/squalene synthase family protein [Paramicrobacterium agarici]|uniref:phytoene/squalene synthase family protein n=1 Tax=Paramicrobacterium agarici TaxID=630514 RepID=UPI00114F8A4E|nr:phytoene/squalene synthase family protein [Microbacterium agarici]TQO23656.1 phytoene/squalene synthetase [Microbacterium agarici]